uniref:Ig-like domain-containing protein n=1 Tax=Neogobius melanostomus TaxID=47308 RepID=A0A8C6UGS8_9GOBI
FFSSSRLYINKCVCVCSSAGGSAEPPQVKMLRDGDKAEIKCHIPGSLTVAWFRILDESGMDFIASVSSVNPSVKKQGPEFDSHFSTEQIGKHTLVLKAFRGSDAGAYSCAALGRDVTFGPVTRLQPGLSTQSQEGALHTKMSRAIYPSSFHFIYFTFVSFSMISGLYKTKNVLKTNTFTCPHLIKYYRPLERCDVTCNPTIEFRKIHCYHGDPQYLWVLARGGRVTKILLK